MNSYQSGHHEQNAQQTQFNTFGSSMLQEDKKPEAKAPMISFQYHPGFLCFFQDYVKSKDWTYYECFQKVFHSHHQMMKIRNPTESILKNTQLGKAQIINQLMLRAEKGKKYAYYKQKQNGQLQCNVIIHEDKRIQRIQKLKKQLQKLEKIKEKVIDRKKKQFQKKEIQRTKQLEKQAMNLMTQKQRRAHLVEKIQKQAAEKRNKKLQQPREERSQIQNFNMCQIM